MVRKGYREYFSLPVICPLRAPYELNPRIVSQYIRRQNLANGVSYESLLDPSVLFFLLRSAMTLICGIYTVAGSIEEFRGKLRDFDGKRATKKPRGTSGTGAAAGPFAALSSTTLLLGAVVLLVSLLIHAHHKLGTF